MSSSVDNAPRLILFLSSISLAPSTPTYLPYCFSQRELTSATFWTRPHRRTRWWRTATTPTVKWSPCCANQRTSSMLPSPPPTQLRHCRAARSVHLYWHFYVFFCMTRWCKTLLFICYCLSHHSKALCVPHKHIYRDTCCTDAPCGHCVLYSIVPTEAPFFILFADFASCVSGELNLLSKQNWETEGSAHLDTVTLHLC